MSAVAERPQGFGEYLKYLRRRARLTQRDLGVQVGYSTGQICMLENGQRSPDPTALAALFVPALGIERDEKLTTRLFDLARSARYHKPAAGGATPTTPLVTTREEVGTLEDPPALPVPHVLRASAAARLAHALAQDRLVLLVGLPGMGKTTLAAHHAHAHVGPVLWITLSAGINNTPDAVLRELSLFAFVHAPDKLRAAALMPGVTGAAPINLDQRLSLISSLLRETQSPLLVLDNAHHISEEAGVLNALAHLRTRVPEAHILLTSREQFSPRTDHAALLMDGLLLAELSQLALLLGRPLDAGALDALMTHTHGSPLLARLALGGDTQAGGVSDALEALSTPALRLLEMLSVLRGPVDLREAATAALLEKGLRRYNHATALDQLQRRQLVGEPRAARVHALVRDYVRETLAARPTALAATHKLAARWMEQTDQPVQAAHHWCGAGEPEKGCDLLAERSERFITQGLAEEATAVVEDVLRAAEPLPATVRNRVVSQMRELRGDLLANGLRNLESVTDYRTALELAGQDIVRARLAIKLANSLLQRGASAEALELCDNALSLLDATSDSAATYTRAQCQATRGHALLQLSRPDDARAASDQCLLLAGRVALQMPRLTDHIRARAHSTLGIVNRMQRNPAQARVHLLKAIDHARLAGLRMLEARNLFNLGNLLIEIGDLDGARRHFMQAAPLADAVGDIWVQARLTHALATVLQLRGESAQALTEIERSIQHKQLMNDPQGTANSMNQRAMILLTLGRADEARSTAERILADTAHTGEQWLRAQYLNMLGLTLCVLGQHAKARGTLDEALAMDAARGDARLLQSIRTYSGVAALARADLPAAASFAADVPPETVGSEVLLEHALMQAAVALAHKDLKLARDRLAFVHTRGSEQGYLLYVNHAAQLQALAGKKPSPSMLVHAMIVTES